MVVDCVGINPYAMPGVVVKELVVVSIMGIRDKCLFKLNMGYLHNYSEMTDSDTSLQGPLASFI